MSGDPTVHHAFDYIGNAEVSNILHVILPDAEDLCRKGLRSFGIDIQSVRTTREAPARIQRLARPDNLYNNRNSHLHFSTRFERFMVNMVSTT